MASTVWQEVISGNETAEQAPVAAMEDRQTIAATVKTKKLEN
jgi:hypothetical protein